MGYQADFVRDFGRLFATDGARQNCEGHGVESMEFDEQTENVTIHFVGGSERKVNVGMDSLSSMAYDIVRHGLW